VEGKRNDTVYVTMVGGNAQSVFLTMYARFVKLPWPAVAAGALGLSTGSHDSEACGIVGVVGKHRDKDDARGFLLEGLQVFVV
jgi:hypothetical protein